MSTTKKNKFQAIEVPTALLPDIEELTGDLRLLAEIVGVATAVRICLAFDGVPLRLWGAARIKRRWRDNFIRQEYDKGDSVIELARRHRLSDRQVRTILGRSDNAGQGCGMMQGS